MGLPDCVVGISGGHIGTSCNSLLKDQTSLTYKDQQWDWGNSQATDRCCHLIDWLIAAVIWRTLQMQFSFFYYTLSISSHTWSVPLCSLIVGTQSLQPSPMTMQALNPHVLYPSGLYVWFLEQIGPLNIWLFKYTTTYFNILHSDKSIFGILYLQRNKKYYE